MSVFTGKLNEIEEVSIDRFDGANLESTAFFLSHCHSDHMTGLNSAEFSDTLLERDDVYLYCSEISSCILINDPCYKHLKTKIKALSATRTHILPVPSLEANPKEICVSLIPAGHCPGSVMFFFELPVGNVLFTGDFRVTMTDLKNLSPLHCRDGVVKEIKSCYLDATFLDELYPSFPSREDSLQKVCDLIEGWLGADNNNEILLATGAKYGYEHLYAGINDIFGMKIHVHEGIFRKYRNIRKIGSVITSDSNETRIHACGKNENLCCRKRGVKWKTLRLSCMWFQKEHAHREDIIQICPNYTRICYACHSSYSELIAFLKYFIPKKVTVFAFPRGKSIFEVEKEICDILGGKESRYMKEVDEDDKLWKDEHIFLMKPLQRCFEVSQLQLSEEWSLTESDFISEDDPAAEKSDLDSGEMQSRDSEGSLSFLPQCSTVTDPLATCQTNDDIEIISLSSDDSVEIMIIE